MSDLGNKQVFANNLRHFLHLHNVSQIEVCQILKIKPNTFSDWVNAKTYPRIDKIELLANYFGIEKSDLVELPKKKKNKFVIPVLGRVQAGYPSEAVENILDYEEISEEMARNGKYFALAVKGDSMEPKFSDGDVVIVRKQADVDNGDIAIMLVNGDEATIKKVQKFNGGINLIPTNSSYEVITYSNKEILEKPVVCLGKVVELRAKF